MPPQLLKVFKKYNDAGISLTTVLAVLPLVITALITARITYGDVSQSVYIMNEVGLIQMWTQGVGSLLVGMLPFGMTVLMLYSLKQGKRYPMMYLSALLLSIMVFFVATVIDIILAIALIFIINPMFEDVFGSKLRAQRLAAKKRHDELLVKIDNSQSNEEKQRIVEELDRIVDTNRITIEQLSAKIRSMIFLLGCILLIQLVLSYPTLPQTTLVLREGQSLVGLVMKRDDDRIMIYDQKSKIIRMAYIDSVKSEDVCAKTRPSFNGLGWSSARLMFEYFRIASVPYASCSEG